MRVNRRDFLKLAGLGAGTGILAMADSGIAQSGAKKPNIILCMADDQGWGEMGYYGHPELKTPNFDDMASSGLRFDHFYAAAPVCSPTRGSVMTGRHPNRFGCFSWGRTIRPQEVTVAEALKTAGYVTGHFGKWHLGPVRSGSPVNPGASGFDRWFSAPNFFDNDPILSREGTAVQTSGESSMVTVDAALEFIREQAEKDQPFLAVVWFGSPHQPHQALKSYRDMYADQPEILQNFYGEITAMDYAFGKLRDQLTALGIRDNTILWYNSDNGGLPEVGSPGGRGHKGQIYEGGLRVPALLEWPERIRNNRVVEMPCNTTDIYPTLLEIAGVSIASQPPLDGVSLTGIIDGEDYSRPRPMGFWHHSEEGGIGTPSAKWMAELLEAQKSGSKTGDLERLRLDSAQISQQYPEDSFPGHSAWLDWPWKFHRIQEKSGSVSYELYNLDSDSMEEKNLLDEYPERVERMKTELERWLVSVVRSLNGDDYR